MVEFRVLGPVEVMAGGGVVELGPPQQRLVLAVLAYEAGRAVTVETVIDRVWDEAPAGARRTLHVAVTRLRRILERAGTAGEPVRVVRRGGGYVLQVDPDRVDVLRYRRMVAQAREPHCTQGTRIELLRQALALWRGEPLSGLSGAWAARTRLAWRQQHLDTVVTWARAELRAGDPAAVVAPLGDLAGEHPLTESLTEMLMRALHATGRPAEALTAYDTVRRRLADELGTDPGPELRTLYQQILRGQLAPPSAAVPPAPAGAAGAADRGTVPRQLPAAVPHFAGRAGELAVLTGLVEQRTGPGGTVVISAIGGTAGVGKTALAVHWAHQVAEVDDRFPDGQLYVNLRGFDPSGSVMDPAEAVRRFLDALRVPPERIPIDLDAQAALYRSELAGRRMLVVLDNARDTAQVRPLLPGAPTCLVLVTSRNQLSGLVAADGAHPVTLDLLTEEEARQLLARRLGVDRVAAEPDAVAEILTRCARLPLALSLVAAHAALRPDAALHTVADELRGAQQRWEALTGDDPTTDTRTVFSWSYQALTPDAARLFRLLGLHPGPDIAAPAAASLAGIGAAAVRRLLGELTRTSVLVEQPPGRYTFHDLLRAYATDLTGSADSGQQRHAALHRILDHYLHTANTADRLLGSSRDPLTLTPPQPGVTPERPTDHQQALGWFATECPVLLAAVDHAATTGFDTHTFRLARTLQTFLDRRGQWHDQVTTSRAAVAAAQRLADPPAQAHAHRMLASAYIMLSRLGDAHTQLGHALDLATRAGDQTGQAHTHHRLASLWERWGRPAQALDHARNALDLYQAAGHHRGRAIALNAVGWCHALLGDHRRALTFCQRALTLHQDLGNRGGQAATWDSLGYIHHHLGQHARAVACYQHALTLHRDFGDRYHEATVLTHLGDAHHAAGNHQAARDAWQHALTILDDLDHPDADQVRTTLATGNPQPLPTSHPAG